MTTWIHDTEPDGGFSLDNLFCFLLQENGDYLLQENSSKILVEISRVPQWTSVSTPSASWIQSIPN